MASVSVNEGHLLITASLLFFIIAGYAVLFSSFLPPTGVNLLDALAEDTHYKYFSVLVVPMTVFFVIANWVGWQYFQNT